MTMVMHYIELNTLQWKKLTNGKRILLSGNCRTKWRKPRESNELLAKIAGPAARGKKKYTLNLTNGGFEPWIDFIPNKFVGPNMI
jgi:hypothetical protein